MKVYLVGIGTDGRRTLTEEAKKAIEASELLIGAERMLEPFLGCGKKTICAYLPKDISDILGREGFGTASVLLSGDTGFFSGAAKLKAALEAYDTETVCGISSPAYLCAKSGLSYERMKFVSLHGREGNIAVNVRMNERCFFLLGGNISAGELCQRLCEYGLPDVTVHIGERLGYPDERIISGRACELCDIRTDRLCSAAVVNHEYLRHIPSCINDGDFIRRDIPMTKSAVRGSIVSGLEIGRDMICWDIGCGTGSVSVEMAFRCPDGRVYAFDKKPDAVKLTDENARRFGCDNIVSLTAELPSLPDDVPPPDRVFIGGSSGNMDGIFELVRERNPHAAITVSAVSIETLTQTTGTFERLGGEYSVTQLAVTETHKVGGHTMLKAQNPVFIIKGRLV